jgi:hypothetical protein
MDSLLDEQTLHDWQREWRRPCRAQQAEIRRDARRRLGLPEEES